MTNLDFFQEIFGSVKTRNYLLPHCALESAEKHGNLINPAVTSPHKVLELFERRDKELVRMKYGAVHTVQTVQQFSQTP